MQLFRQWMILGMKRDKAYQKFLQSREKLRRLVRQEERANMKTLLLAIGFLLITSSAWAQKACTRVSATVQTCTATLTWNASVVDATHDAPTSYIVRRADGTGAKVQVGTVPAGTMTLQNVFSDAGNVDHSWDVIAVNSGGQSAPSTSATWTTPAILSQPPNAPSGSTLAAISSSQLQASWRDNSDNEEKFKVVLNGFNPPRQFVNYALANAQNLTVGGLQRNKTYCAKVSALAGGLESAPDNEQCATTKK